jgi:hypothetical protein
LVDGSRKITLRYDTPAGAVAESVYGPPNELGATSMSVVIVWIAGEPICVFAAL